MLTLTANSGSQSVVVIVTHNSAGTIGDCLREIVGMPEVDVVLVDNRSTDGTAKQVESVFPSVRVIAPGKNVGFGRACNVAVQEISASFILLINPDAIAPPDAIRNLVWFMEWHPRVGISGARLIDRSGRPLQSMGDKPSIRGLIIDKALAPFAKCARSEGLLRWFLGAMSSKYRLPTCPERTTWVSGAAMCVRREAWTQVGGFDENIFLYYDDVDLCLRVAQAGWEVWHVPEAVVTHHSGASFAGDQDWQKREHYASQRYFFQKHGGKLSAIILGVLQSVYAGLGLYRYLARDRIGRPLNLDR